MQLAGGVARQVEQLLVGGAARTEAVVVQAFGGTALGAGAEGDRVLAVAVPQRWWLSAVLPLTCLFCPQPV